MFWTAELGSDRFQYGREAPHRLPQGEYLARPLRREDVRLALEERPPLADSHDFPVGEEQGVASDEGGELEPVFVDSNGAGLPGTEQEDPSEEDQQECEKEREPEDVSEEETACPHVQELEGEPDGEGCRADPEEEDPGLPVGCAALPDILGALLQQEAASALPGGHHGGDRHERPRRGHREPQGSQWRGRRRGGARSP